MALAAISPRKACRKFCTPEVRHAKRLVGTGKYTKFVSRINHNLNLIKYSAAGEVANFRLDDRKEVRYTGIHKFGMSNKWLAYT